MATTNELAGPFTVELTVSDDQATLYLNLKPSGASSILPSGEAILADAVKRGFPIEGLISAAEVDQRLAEAVASGKPLTTSPLSLAHDAFYEITVSEDQQQAVLNVTKGSGEGKVLTLAELGKAINGSGLKLADRDRVKKDIPAFFRGSERQLKDYVLAVGTAPAAVPKQSLEWMVDEVDKRAAEDIKKQVASNAAASLADFPLDKLSGLAFVDKDQRVAKLGPVVQGNPGFDVYGKVLPGQPSEPVKLKLFGHLEQLQVLVVAKAKGLLLWAEESDGFSLALVEHADAAFRIEVAPDNMGAWLQIDAHQGSGKPLVSDQVKAEIAKVGIKKGLLTEVLDKALQDAVAGKDVEKLLIAQGKAPNSGAKSVFQFLVALATGQEVKIRSDGTADYRNQDRLTTVTKDTPIAEILPPTALPEAGYDIMGKDLSPTVDNTPEYQVGANIRQETQDGGRVVLIANSDGELKHENGKLEIVAAFTVKGNIDNSTGNIKFPGMVQISGDVLGGFYIVAGGPIMISGSVEGALLSSDQDIVLQGGMKGHEKGVLRARGGISATYIEQATVLGIGDIKIKKSLARSKVKCNSRLIMADEAHIIGGETKVKLGLVVGSLGSELGVATKVFFGQDILVEDQMEVEKKEIIKLQTELGSIDLAMKRAERANDKAGVKEIVDKKIMLIKVLEKRQARLFTLMEKFEQHFESEIIVKGTIYPGVVIETQGRTLEFLKPKQKVKIRFDTTSGRLVETALDAKGT